MNPTIWQGRDRLILDGSMGLSLKSKGVEVPTDIWSAHALMAAPDVVRELHADYIRAGADIITTNNYSCTPYYLKRRGIEDRMEELTTLSTRLAREAVEQSGSNTLIAGALPPLGGSYDPGDVQDAATSNPINRRIAKALTDDIDLVICETMSSIAEARMTAEAAAETGKPVWLALTLTDDDSATLRSGETLADTVAAMKGLEIDAWLFNCCSPDAITAGIKTLKTLTDSPIGAYANAFNPVPEGWTLEEGGITYDEILGVDAYETHAKAWQDLGASIIGGCCGIGPDHIHRVSGMAAQE
ncbi:MAG: homocysteine S-methyltransferase family protein [Alphaproteobacteria bacterium]|nr:homocysteine S-methyltransferase family protein [Alphaproteobacteria bacterium]